jgi:hypothetical protein
VLTSNAFKYDFLRFNRQKITWGHVIIIEDHYFAKKSFFEKMRFSYFARRRIGDRADLYGRMTI